LKKDAKDFPLRPFFFQLIGKSMPEELLDVVDDADLVIGQEFRAAVHLRGLQHRGVHIFLVTAENKLVVQQRGRRRDTSPLALDCSVSEHVKAGESYREAARRGLAEELGLREANIHAMIKFKMDYGPNDKEICQLYEGRVDSAQVRFDPFEVERIASYSLGEMEELISAGQVAFSGWFIQLLQWYLGRPSNLQVLKNYSKKRLLLPEISR
jgi:isopentenyl-diphosphate Delta-isomerase